MSPAYSRHLRMVGDGSPRLFELKIGHVDRFEMHEGKNQRVIARPYLPKNLGEELHPGGNSVCFAIQLAHLMGAENVFLAGFTLQDGSRYFFGNRNPVLHRPAIYDARRSLHWLKWYESSYPGKARLLPGWGGPIYDVLQVVSDAELGRRLGSTGDVAPAEGDGWLC